MIRAVTVMEEMPCCGEDVERAGRSKIVASRANQGVPGTSRVRLRRDLTFILGLHTYTIILFRE